MRYFSRFYKGRQDTITILNRNPLNLYRGPTPLSQHQTIEGAVRAAYRDARQNGNATYRVRVDGGNYVRFSITLPDRGAIQASTQVGLDVALVLGAPWQPPVVSSTPTPSFTEGTPGTYEFEANITRTGLPVGFDYPITYSLNGTVDPSLSLAAATGVLTYDGSAGTTYSLTLTVTDAQGADTSSSFDMTITAIDTAPVVSTPSFSAFTEGTASTRDLSAYVTDDGYSAVTYAIQGALPGGVTLAASTGILSYNGIALADTRSVTFTATDAVGTSNTSGSFNITIAEAGQVLTGVASISITNTDAAITGSTTAVLEYRENGSGTWLPGPYPTIVGTTCYGMVWGLDTGTTYDWRLTYTNGPASPATGAETTSSLPTETRDNSPTSTVTTAQELRDALAGTGGFPTPGPGTIIEVDGAIVYDGSPNDATGWTLAVDGTAAQPIYLRGKFGASISKTEDTSSFREVLGVTGSHWVIEDLRLFGSLALQNQFGVYLESSSGSNPIANITVRRCYIESAAGVGMDSGSSNADVRDCNVYDNTMQGRDDFASLVYVTWDDVGIAINGLNHMVFNNTLRGYGDGCKIKPNGNIGSINIAYSFNDMQFARDDGIELDGADYHCVVYESRFTNCNHPISFQPNQSSFAPNYAVRNVIANWDAKPFKLQAAGSDAADNMRIIHNTVVRNGPAGYQAFWIVFNSTDFNADANVFNNIMLATTAPDDALIFWEDSFPGLEMDGNAYYPDQDFRFTGSPWSTTSPSFAAAQVNASMPPGYSGATFEASGELLSGNPFKVSMADQLDGVTTSSRLFGFDPTLSATTTARTGAVPLPGYGSVSRGAREASETEWPIYGKSFPDGPLKTAAMSLDYGEQATAAIETENVFEFNGLEWQAACHYDPVNFLVHVMAKRANDNDDWKHRYYDIRNDTWVSVSVADGGLWSDPGHIYDNMTIDPVTGDVFCTSNDNWIHRYQASSRTWLARFDAFPGAGATNGHCNGAAFHPHLYGPNDGALCVHNGAGYLSVWRRSTQTVDVITMATGFGSTASAAAYCESANACIIGGTKGAKHFTVTPNPTLGGVPVITDVGVPPMSTAGDADDSRGSLIPHPQKGTMLLCSRETDNNVWESSDGDNWTVKSDYSLITARHDAMLMCSIPELGVIFATGIRNSPRVADHVVWRPEY